MKKAFLGMAACAMLCACSSDDIVSIANQGAAYDGEAVYMTVNIKDVGDASTRGTAGDFAYGSEDERSISNAHFYFFDKDKRYVTETEAGNISGTANTDTTANVEWESNTVLALYGLGTDMYPSYMVTVLNQPAGFSYKKTNLADLRAALANAEDAYADAKGNFVMSTSAYWDGSDSSRADELSITTALEETDFRDEPIAMESDYTDQNGAVDVYVERLAAKAQMQIGSLTDGNGSNLTTQSVYVSGEGRDASHTYTAFAASGVLDEIESADDNLKSLYIAFKGWTLNGTARNSYMMKNVDTSWNTSTPWNTSSSAGDVNDNTNHRSYWGMSWNYDDADHVYPETAVKNSTVSYIGNYDADEENEETMLDSYLKYTSLLNPTAFGEGNYNYCGENTNTAGEGKVLQNNRSTAITNALVLAQAGTLSYDNVLTPVDLVKWEGELYTVEEFLDRIAADASDVIMTQTLYEVVEKLGENTGVQLVLGLVSLTTDDLVAIADAAEHGLYVSSEKMSSSTSSDDLQLFDGSFLNLVNHGNGYVGVRVNAATAQAHQSSAIGTQYYPATYYHASDVTGENVTIAEEYQKEGSYTWSSEKGYGGTMTAVTDWTPAYSATNSLDAGEGRAYMYFKIDASQINETLLEALSELNLVVTTSDDVTLLYMDSSISLQDAYHGTQEEAKENGYYTLPEYTVWAIERECQNIIDYWEAHNIKPNLMKDGLMYYTVPVQHVVAYSAAIAEGMYGMVRNHWYSLTVNSVSQLGHGIADEEEVIVPSPEDEYKYLGVDLNILSWKMVEQSVGF